MSQPPPPSRYLVRVTHEEAQLLSDTRASNSAARQQLYQLAAKCRELNEQRMLDAGNVTAFPLIPRLRAVGSST